MGPSGGKALIAMILPALILICAAIGQASSVSCTYKTTDNYCVMSNISVRSDSEANSIGFPNEKSLWFVTPNFSQSGKMIFSHISKATQFLVISNGSVPEVTIKSTFSEFRAHGNHLQEVIIDETGPYSLTHLGIWKNKLRSVPENITKLTKLVELYLYENEIETVNMDHFRGLTHLQLLSLYGNRITRIDTTAPLTLPNLTKLFLFRNYLDNFSITSWNFPQLKHFYVNSNKLRSIESFPDHFPNLFDTTLYYNRWNCSWLNYRANLWTGKILVHQGDESCSEHNIRGICCEDDTKNYLVKTVADQLDQTSSKLQSDEAQIEGKLSALTSDIQKVEAEETKNRAIIMDDRRKFEKSLNAHKNDMNRNVQAIHKDVQLRDSRINAKVFENRAQIGKDRKQLDEKIDHVNSVSNRNIQKMKEEFKTMHSSATREVLDKFEEINEKESKNRALINNNRKNMEKIVDDLKSNVDHTVQALKKEVKSEDSRINSKVTESQAQIGNDRKQLEKKVDSLKSDSEQKIRKLKQDLKTMESNAKKQVLDKFEEINENMNKKQTQLERKVDVVKNDLIEKLNKSNSKMKLIFKWMKTNFDHIRTVMWHIVDALG